MIKEIRQLYCDACKHKIPCGNYSCRRDVIEIDEDGFAHSTGLDFCEECTKSFAEWMKSREKEARND